MTQPLPFSDEGRVPWLELLETLLRRWRLVLALFLIGILLSALVASSEPTIYRAIARIQLTAQALAGPRVEAMTDRQIRAELAILTSPGLLRTMLEEHSSDGDALPSSPGSPDGLGRVIRQALGAPARWLRGGPSLAPADRKIESWASRIEIDRVGESNVVAVAFTDESPEGAAGFVNSLLEQHIQRIANLGEGSEARSFYEEQAELLAEKWRQANDQLVTFRREHGAEVSEVEIQRTISSLESDRVATETSVLELQATIDFLSEQMSSLSPTVEGELLERRDESVDLLKARLLELQIERIELLSTYTVESTVVRDLDRQIGELQELLRENEDEFIAETLTEPNPSHQALEVDLLQARARLKAARARLGALDQQIAGYRQKRVRIEEVVGTLSRLETAARSAREDHETYLRRIEDARLESALGASGRVNVTIIERADVPLSPLPSRRRLTLLLGGAVALLIGVAGSFVRDALDPTLKSGRQVARLTGLPVLAEIPGGPAARRSS